MNLLPPRPLCASLLIVGTVLLLARIHATITSAHGRDFGRVYYATQAWWAGGSLYQKTIATDEPQPPDGKLEPRWNLNPPHWHVVVWPFALLPFTWAVWGWVAVNFVLIDLAAYRAGWGTSSVTLLIAAWATVSAVGAVAAFTLQPLGIYLWLGVELWRAWERGSENKLGVWLGVLLSLKLFFLLPWIWIVMQRRRRAAFIAPAVCIAIFVIGAAIFDARGYVRWVEMLESFNWRGESIDASWLGFWSRCLGATRWHEPMIQAADGVDAVTLLSACVMLGLTWVTARRRTDQNVTLLALLCAMVLISPAGWVYYLTFAVPAAVAAWPELNGFRWIAVTWLTVPANQWLVHQPSAFATLTVDSSAFWSALALWASTLRLQDTQPSTSAIESATD